jgi:hypothetical protein
MKTIWNIDGVYVFEPMSVTHNDGSVWINGIGTYNSRPFEFHALALQHGYFIEIIAINGKRGDIQGSTFNLGLEVASAVRRLM